jgi:hypothetical protein
MRTFIRDLRWTGVLMLLAIFNVGCSVGSGARLIPQSYFDYPNSNVTPLGRVQAELSTSNFFYPKIEDPDLMEEVIQAALKQKGGDLLLDYLFTYQIMMVPIPFLTVFTTTYKVDGTAAKMEIGKQSIR